MNYKYLLLLTISSFVFSCSDEVENIDTQNELVESLETLGLKKVDSPKEISQLKGEIKSISFRSNTEAIEFVKNSMIAISSFNEKNILELNESSSPSSKMYASRGSSCTKRITLSNSYGLGTNFNVSYSATIGNDGNVTGVNSINTTMTENTLGISYDETYSSSTINAGGCVSTFTQGVINYNLFTEGIGTVWRSNINIRTSYCPNPCGQNGGSGLAILATFILEYAGAENGNNNGY